MIRRLLSSQFRTNMASGAAMSLVNLVVFAVAYPIYLHTLGYEKYGVWLLLVTVLEFAQLGSVGLAPAVAKLVAEEYGRRNFQGIQAYVATALAMLLVTGLAVGAAVAVFRGAIVAAFGLTGENAELARSLLPYVGALAVYGFLVQAFAATVSGLGRMDLANYAATASRMVAAGLSIGLLLAGRGLESLVIGMAASYAVIHVASVLCIRRVAPLKFLRPANLDRGSLRRLLPFTGQVMIGSVASLLFSPFNKLMLARFAGPGAIPIYDIAFSGSMQVRNIVESGFRALMPEVSLLDAQGTAEARRRIRTVYGRSLRLIGLFGPPACVGLVIAVGPLLRLWLDGRFDEALPLPMRIMLVGAYFSLLCVPAYYTLMGLGLVHHCLGAHVVQTGVSVAVVVGTVLVTGELSVTAVAWAVLAGMAATCVYLLFQQHRAGQEKPELKPAPLRSV